MTGHLIGLLCKTWGYTGKGVEVPKQCFIYLFINFYEWCCFLDPVTASVITLLWTAAANGKHGSVTSSQTVAVLLHLFPDLIPHHGGVLLQLVQLHALLLHPLLVTLELFLQFCNHREFDRSQHESQRQLSAWGWVKVFTLWITDTVLAGGAHSVIFNRGRSKLKRTALLCSGT